MKNGGKNSFNFHGVNWYHNSHVVETRASDDAKLPNVSKNNCDEEKKTWCGTRREMAKVLGLLNWHRQVHDIRFSNPEHAKASSAIRNVYRVLTPKENEKWEDEFTVSGEDYEGLKEAWLLRASQSPAVAVPLVTTVREENVVYGAVDAATNDDQKNALAAAIMFDGGEEVVRVRGFSDPGMPIAYGELESAELLVDTVFERRPQLKDGLVVLGTDSMVSKHWLDSRDARCDYALEILGRIEAKLKARRCRL